MVIIYEHLVRIISFLVAIIFTRVLEIIVASNIIRLLKFIVSIIDERIQERLVEIFQNRNVSLESQVFIIIVPKYFELFLAKLFRNPLKMRHIFIDLHYHLLIGPLLRFGHKMWGNIIRLSLHWQWSCWIIYGLSNFIVIFMDKFHLVALISNYSLGLEIVWS